MSTERWADSPWLRRVLGLAPLPAPPHVFSLSSDGLSYARLEPTGGERLEVRETRRAELPAGTVRPGVLGGPLSDPVLFGETLDELLMRISAVPARASLVLPDAWVRMAFIEVEELPGGRRERQEVFRWKLKRIVPYRIEDLRIDADEVPPLPRRTNGSSDAEIREVGDGGESDPGRAPAGETRRFVLLFALEALLDGLEDAFAAREIHVGRLVSESAAIHASLSGWSKERSLAGIVTVTDEGYVVLFLRRGDPVLYRFKSVGTAPREPSAAELTSRGGTVERDLRLTRGFLRDHFPDLGLEEVSLLAPSETTAAWTARIERALGVVPRTVAASELGLTGVGPNRSELPISKLAALAGAARREIE